MVLPRMIPVRQRFVSRRVRDIPGTVQEQWLRSGVAGKIKAGDRVAITAGSRGIANYPVILRAIVDQVREAGGEPFIVPAMGTHGGATAEGQLQVLLHYGVTPEAVGCPILSDMAVVELGQTRDGVRVYVDRNNRVKQHTDFIGTIESGLTKMMCIGLGKKVGAVHYHQAGIDFGFERTLRAAADIVMQKAPVLCGIPVVEDGYDQTAIIEVLPPAEMRKREEELLVLAKEWTPRLPFDRMDVLIVDWIGKNISGAGMDTKVIGRILSPYSAQPEWPKIRRIVALDVTAESEGNCFGIGNADFTTRRLVEKMDRERTYVNALGAQCPNAARVPPYFDSDVEMLERCFATIGLKSPERSRVVRIRSTLHLEHVWVSEAYAEELAGREDLEVDGPPVEFQFDDQGRLLPM